MNEEMIEERVEKIRRSVPLTVEAAHSMEDTLYRDVLIDIAKGDTYDGDLARAALKSREIEFARWGA